MLTRKPGESVTASWMELRAVPDRANTLGLEGGETLYFEKTRITIRIVKIRGGRVVLHLDADERVKFLRSELEEDLELEDESVMDGSNVSPVISPTHKRRMEGNDFNPVTHSRPPRLR